MQLSGTRGWRWTTTALGVLVFVLLCLFVATQWLKWTKRERAISFINQRGGLVVYTWMVDDRGKRLDLADEPSLLEQLVFGRPWAVSLRGTSVSDDDLRFLVLFPELVNLNLADTSIGDAGIKNLRYLTELRFLQLEGTGISDAGISQLVGLKKLEYLSLHGTKISDRSIPKLSQLRQLKYLSVVNTSLSKQGLARLRAALPATDIVTDPAYERGPVREV